MKEVTLKSGKILRIGLAPFATSKNLFDAICTEMRESNIDAKQEVDVNFIKNALFGLLSSKQVELALNKCLERCVYDGSKIIPEETFESEAAREDYLEICFEVSKANVMPFMKNLSSKFAPFLSELGLNLG